MQDLPAFCLMGEYVGVLTTGDAAEKATEHCPLGFGGLRNDKLKDLSHSRQQHSSDFIGESPRPNIPQAAHSYPVLSCEYVRLT